MASPPGYCTTSAETIRDLYLVAGPRPSGTIGRDVTDGSPFYAPGSHDTVPATLISIHCPQADQAQLLITVNGRGVMLAARSIPLRTMQARLGLLGDLLVRQQGATGSVHLGGRAGGGDGAVIPGGRDDSLSDVRRGFFHPLDTTSSQHDGEARSRSRSQEDSMLTPTETIAPTGHLSRNELTARGVGARFRNRNPSATSSSTWGTS